MFIDNLLLSESMPLLMGGSAALFGARLGYDMLRGQPIQRDLAGLSRAVLPVGLLTLAIALDGEYTWPLPGSYNILYWDPLVLLAIVAIAWSLGLMGGGRTVYYGLLTALAGAVTIAYGVTAYGLHMSNEPLVLLLLYLGYGLTGILSLPLSIAIDGYAGGGKASKGYAAIAFAFAVLAVLSILVDVALIGFTLPAHLAKPP